MRRKHDQGITLIDLMISLTISLILLAGSTSFYFLNKVTYQIETALARMEENGRFLSYYLLTRLSHSNNYGCLQNVTSVNNLIRDQTVAFGPGGVFGVDGLANGFAPALPSHITGTPVPGTDVIGFSGASTNNILLTSHDMAAQVNPLNFHDDVPIKEGDAVVVTNCEVADLFIASSGTNANTVTHHVAYNTSNALSTRYESNSQVFLYETESFYIQDTGRVNADNQPVYALVSENMYHEIKEIAHGVEQMQVVYAIDTDTTPGTNIYQTAAEVQAASNWNRVVGVQISLLINSVEKATTAPQSYYYNGETLSNDDKMLRRQWDIFIPLVNRGGAL